MARYVMVILPILLVLGVAAGAQNMLVDPGMQSLATATWSRSGTAPAITNALWNSQALGWSNGHGDPAPNYYAVIAKRSGYTPNDTTTQARGYWFQKVYITAPGDYMFSGWYKIGASAGRTAMWDGAGGLDQCALLGVEFHYTDGTANKWFWSPKAEVVTNNWTRQKLTVSIPANVDYVNVYCYAWLLDQWVNALDMTYVAWDDFFFGRNVNLTNNISEVKSIADGEPVRLTGKIVTRLWGNQFYIEDEDRTSGIGVVMPSGYNMLNVLPDYAMDVQGSVATRGQERYIAGGNAVLSAPERTATIAPLLMTAKSLVGGPRIMNKLVNASFESGLSDWATSLSHPASMVWQSDGMLAPINTIPAQDGARFAVAAKWHLAEPLDTTTPVTTRLYQAINTGITPGVWEASAWAKAAGFDGPGGVGENAYVAVGLFRDAACTDVISSFQSPVFESTEAGWKKLGVTFTVPPECLGLRINLWATHVGQTWTHYVVWDDAMLGMPATRMGPPADGMLVRICGTAVYVHESIDGDVDPVVVRIDDGSGIPVTVSYRYYAAPQVGDTVTVTGIAGIDANGNPYVRPGDLDLLETVYH